MAATVTAVSPAPPATPVPALLRVRRLRDRVTLRTGLPTLFVVANAIAFVLVRPDVNDLWAARARASAVAHGVGLTYWFSWFGGGSTPGNYSVVTPYLCAYLGTELVGGLSAVAVIVLATLAVRNTRHPVLASSVAALGAAANLWSGRVPFLLGAAIALGALIALRGRRRTLTVLLTVASILASPVSGAFLAMGLSGTFLTTRTKEWRPIIAWAAVTTGVALIGVAIVFGAPGPEPFSIWLVLQILFGLILLAVARPPDHLRTTLWVTLLLTFALYAIPNGMGSNFARFVWFCLPVAVAATSTRRRVWAATLTVPLVLIGATATVNDLKNAVRPISSVSYYDSLTARLDRIHGLANYRVEVVNHGAHAGYDALLGHVSLARGWETQEDLALNASLNQNPLPATTYKVWLDNNAVGYVALPSSSVGGYPEYALVQSGQAGYLQRVWSNADWQLFKVRNPTPIVGRPARILGHTQSSMTIQIPCACAVGVRVRWSKFLGATLQPVLGKAAGGRPALPTRAPDVTAKVTDDGSGWTMITTTRPGAYRLSGSFRGVVR